MSRRTFASVAAEAAREERGAAVAYARAYVEDVRALVGKGRITAEEGAALARRIAAFADGIERGLHR